MTGYNPTNANAQAWNSATSTDYTSTLLLQAGTAAFRILATGISGMSLGGDCIFHWVADARLT
jgi:hypothetical protein